MSVVHVFKKLSDSFRRSMRVSFRCNFSLLYIILRRVKLRWTDTILTSELTLHLFYLEHIAIGMKMGRICVPVGWVGMCVWMCAIYFSVFFFSMDGTRTANIAVANCGKLIGNWMCEDRLQPPLLLLLLFAHSIFIFRLQRITKQKYKCQQIGSARMNVKILHAAIYMHEFRWKTATWNVALH